MKASKKLQKQFADFKAEFACLCKAFGGERNQRADHTGGENSAFEIKLPWGTLHASISLPWSIIDGSVYPGERNRSSAGIYISARDYKELPESWGSTFLGSIQKHWKWNIHMSAPAGGMFVECANECLSEFSRRLEKVTGKKESAGLELPRHFFQK